LIDRGGRQRDVLVHSGVFAAMALAFAADLMTPLGVAVWIFYLVPLVLCLLASRAGLPLVVSAVGTLLILAAFLMSPSTAAFDPQIAQLNRSFGIVTLWIVAFTLRQLIQSRLELGDRDWLKEGLATLTARLQGEQSDVQLGENILATLCIRLDAPVGVLYAADGAESFRLVAGRALAPDTRPPSVVRAGERLGGAAILEGRVLLLEDLPEDYLPVSTAFGRARARNVVAVPLTAEGHVIGLCELAFARPPRPIDLELLQAAAEPAGVALRSLAYRTRLNELLDETQRQAEELQAQQEELRAINEQLGENNRALRESESLLEAQQAELETTNAELESQTSEIEGQLDALLQAQQELLAREGDLTRANQYKSEFLANMSHELRTPLNSTLILSKLLADNRDGNLTALQARYAQTIHSASNDLLALINDILDLARVESGRVEFEVQAVAIGPVLDALERLFQPVADEKGLAYLRTCDPLAPSDLRTDARRLQQVLRNLLSNAFKFTSAGQVSMTVRPHGANHVAFEVRDTGIGIAPEQQAQIFEAFRQASGGIERRYGGTGLGLALSRELAQRLGGEIHVASEPGIGSAFTLVLPVRGAAIADERPVPQPPLHLAAGPVSAPRLRGVAAESGTARSRLPRTPGSDGVQAVPDSGIVPDDRAALEAGARSVLIVEDDPNFAMILRDLAREQGFRCLVATTAVEAIALVAHSRPTAVLLDVQLPDDSGLRLLDHFKRTPELRHVPVQVMSIGDYAEQALGLGALGYALKPVAREQIVEALARMGDRAAGGTRRLLVVEDSDAQREGVRALLESEQIEILAVGTGAQALEALRSAVFDCVVLDLALPDMSGYDVLDRMAGDDACSFPPVIVYTGRSLTRDEEARLRRYASSIVVKSARSPERLLDEVTLFLHQVEAELPPEKQRMLRAVRGRDEALEGRRILLAEDDVRNVFALLAALEPKGLEIEVARNGREALGALERADGAIELVLMDLMMPEMDGLTAMREIRTRPQWRKLPVIALTAKAMPDDRRACLDAGASDYVTKPIDLDKLVSLIRVWLPK